MQDALYPDRLRNIYDPPVLLYGRGRMPLFDGGGRRLRGGYPDVYPLWHLRRRGAGLPAGEGGCRGGVGLARGIDGASHRGALRAGGFTAAVLGGGVDVVYPAENRRLYEDIAATGVLLSEYPPGTEPVGSHFPVRNRILSGLSLAVLVVEAPERSGALITAHTALEQGRDVFAVPGPIDAGSQPGQQPPHPGRRRTCDLRLGHSGGVPQPVSPTGCALVGESSSGAGAGQPPRSKGGGSVHGEAGEDGSPPRPAGAGPDDRNRAGLTDDQMPHPTGAGPPMPLCSPMRWRSGPACPFGGCCRR